MKRLLALVLVAMLFVAFLAPMAAADEGGRFYNPGCLGDERRGPKDHFGRGQSDWVQRDDIQPFGQWLQWWLNLYENCGLIDQPAP